MNNGFLEQKREQIDEIDRQILKLLKKRLSFMPEIAKFKREQGLQTYQPKRESELLENKVTLAKEFGLDEGFILNLFRTILDESKRIQKKSQ